MAFNAASFEYIGGGAHGSIWRYWTADNLSTANVGDIMDTAAGSPSTARSDGRGYWNGAFTSCNVRVGDIVFAVNGSSPCVSTLVCSGADANGVSMVFASGNTNRQ